MLEPQRTHDRALMAIASQFYADSSTLTSINMVRMAHQIIHLSDICTADGQYLNSHYNLNNYKGPSL